MFFILVLFGGISYEKNGDKHLFITAKLKQTSG